MNRGGGWILTAALACMLLGGNTSEAEDTDVMSEVRARLAKVDAKFFYQPISVATDGAGNVYVAEFHSHQILKISPAGEMISWVGKPGVKGNADGKGASALFGYPSGIATDKAGNVYVADTGNFSIRKITPAGVVTTLTVTTEESVHRDGDGPKASFGGTWGITTDSAGNMYVVDYSGFIISKITAAGVVTTFAGAVKGQRRADGRGTAAGFDGAHGIATDSADNLYVADSRNCTIRKITPQGVVTTLAGTAGACGHADGTGAAASFSYPYGIATDGADNIYVSDSGNGTIRKITPAGLVTTLAGTPGKSGNVDGLGAAARFASPWGVATDSAGNVYVADAGNNSIRKITPAGQVTTLANIPDMKNAPKLP